MLDNGRAPYAPTTSVVTVIEQHRRVGLQRMDVQKLQRIGITEGLAPRTMQALVLLGFYDENGAVEPRFDALRLVPDHEFKTYLSEILRSAYKDVVSVMDLATATSADITAAFRGFSPTGQIPRMVQLFVGLMTYAELLPAGAGKTPSGPRPGSSRRVVLRPKRKPASDKDGAGEDAPHPLPPDGDGYTVDANLGTAGSVTLRANVNPLLLSPAEREFFYGLVDAMNAWREGRTPRPANGAVQPTVEEAR